MEIFRNKYERRPFSILYELQKNFIEIFFTMCISMQNYFSVRNIECLAQYMWKAHFVLFLISVQFRGKSYRWRSRMMRFFGLLIFMVFLLLGLVLFAALGLFLLSPLGPLALFVRVHLLLFLGFLVAVCVLVFRAFSFVVRDYLILTLKENKIS